ncbi:MAG: ABC-2 type transport system permease protein [Parcubacteria group bacterium Gr01-1014_72]|nr:MAG: ABC-2 type transport system permease protein [Parcubacteria group bacterium Gr01-1014_72]
MNFHRINALILRNLYLYQRSIPRLMDILYWPVMELLVWGFLSVYIEKLSLGTFNAVTILLGAIIFWDILSNAQRAVSVAFLEDVWEKNFLNLFVTPLRVSEFLAATGIIGFIRIVIVVAVAGVLAYFLYAFNLLVFGWTLGLFTIAIILRFGSQAQILAWGFITLIQPFTAVFYPVSALPAWLQPLAWWIPSTYVFEGMRYGIAGSGFSSSLFLQGLGLNVVYLVLVLIFFYRMFAAVKRQGRLLKLH